MYILVWQCDLNTVTNSRVDVKHFRKENIAKNIWRNTRVSAEVQMEQRTVQIVL